MALSHQPQPRKGLAVLPAGTAIGLVRPERFNHGTDNDAGTLSARVCPEETFCYPIFGGFAPDHEVRLTPPNEVTGLFEKLNKPT